MEVIFFSADAETVDDPAKLYTIKTRKLGPKIL